MAEQRYTRQERDLAKEVNLYEYLRSRGHEMEKNGREYQLKAHDSFKIREDGEWFWHSKGIGGKNPIDAVRGLEGMGLIEAVKDLAAYAKGNTVNSSFEERVKHAPKEREREEFQLPEKNKNYKRTFEYLHRIRGISAELVIDCMEKNLIYESKKYSNVVFVGQADEQGNVKFASLRGTYTNANKPFRGDVTGSDKNYSFALPGNNEKLYVFESPIDALSHATIQKMDEVANWKNVHRLSLSGTSNVALEAYLERHPEVESISLCLDHDEPGQKRAEKIAEQFKGKYEVKIEMPKGKDVNEDLCTKLQGARAMNHLEQAGAEVQDKQEKEDIFAKLEIGVKNVFTSENYTNFLKFLSKFNKYTARNLILIQQQLPTATLTTGFVEWRDTFGRTIKPGENGLKILKPKVKTVKLPVTKIDEKTGEEVQTFVEHKEKNGYTVVSVFDISQTEGRELPTLVKELAGTKEGIVDILNAIKVVSPVPIIYMNIDSGAKGYYSPNKKMIAIQEGMSDIQTVKTAIHELTHAKLHSTASKNDTDDVRRIQEVQAESVAFAVASHFDIDTSEYSFPYIASWTRGVLLGWKVGVWME